MRISIGRRLKQVSGVEVKENVARLSFNGLIALQEMQVNASEGSAVQKVISVSDVDIEKASRGFEKVHNERLKVKAQKDSLPNMKNLQTMLDLYDKQLLADVQAIRAALRSSSGNKRRSDLRPHYKAMLEAYESEFEKDNGLKEEKILSFFDKYVHDSLAAFAKDATLPSDPRVVYLGAMRNTDMRV